LKEKYIKTGKVRYIIRPYPLDRIAFAAAALARCAGQDKYFAFTDALYKQQETWAQGEGSPAPRLFNMAKQAGFTQETFNACMRNKKVIDHIESTRIRGKEKFGVESTPTLFINGKKLDSRTNSLSDIETAMEPYLKG
jgi:protein-disulfide isomerase